MNINLKYLYNILTSAKSLFLHKKWGKEKKKRRKRTMKTITDSIKILNIKSSYLGFDKPYEINNNNKKRLSDGSIPYSLLTLNIQENNLIKFKWDKLTNSYFCDKFVNVNFNCCQKEKKDDKELYFVEGNKVIKKKGTYKVLKTSEELRTQLYENGFDLMIDGEIKHYVYLERTAAKSRTGNAIFVQEDLFNALSNYMNMGLNFSQCGAIDIPSLEVYRSLVCSSIVDYIDIDKNRICIVDDDFIEYESVCSVTSYDGQIHQEDKLYTVKNCIWDGEALIDESLTTHNMVLLRNNFFKSCCISTNIQGFKQKYNIEYFIDKWGNKIKDPLIITTPSSLKFFKFSKHFFNNDEECWEYWKNNSGKHFGIVKYNKPNKFGLYGRMSYQVINSLPGTYSDILELMGDELQYIRNLRSDDESFFQLHINNNVQSFTDNFINTMSNINQDFYKTKLYRNYKNDTINTYIKDLKCSHIKIKNLDYYTVFSLPQLLLKKAGGVKYKWELEGNIGWCPHFQDNELFCWRNPHISTSNLCTFKNYLFDDDLQFFNIEQGNIVIINTKNNMMNICGGMDFDSDTIGITNNKKLIELSKKNTQFKVPVLDIEPTKINLDYNLKNIAICDNTISQQRIGEIVNLSALLLSYYYDIYASDKDDPRLKKLSDMINLLSNSSMMEIDSSKRLYPEKVRSKSIIQYVRNECEDILEKQVIDIKKNQVDKDIYTQYEETKDKSLITKQKETYIKPLFFKYSQPDYKNQYSFRYFNCCSDYIVDILSNTKTKTRGCKAIPIEDLLEKNKEFEHSNRNQIQTIIEKFKAYKNDFNSIQFNNNYDELEKIIEKEKLQKKLLESIEKMKMSSDTIYCILCRMFYEDKEKFTQNKNKEKTTQNLEFLRGNKILILSTICKTHKKEYIECFKYLEGEPIKSLQLDENGNIIIWGKTYSKI
jgi:hypothetical protein